MNENDCLVMNAAIFIPSTDTEQVQIKEVHVNQQERVKIVQDIIQVRALKHMSHSTTTKEHQHEIDGK